VNASTVVEAEKMATKETDESKPTAPPIMEEVRMGHVMIFICLLISAGTFFGYCTGYTNQTVTMLHIKYNWPRERQQAIWDSIISATPMLGLCIGCVTGGKVMQYGRRLSCILACLIGLGGTALNLV
jgi:hypothetical protein